MGVSLSHTYCRSVWWGGVEARLCPQRVELTGNVRRGQRSHTSTPSRQRPQPPALPFGWNHHNPQCSVTVSAHEQLTLTALRRWRCRWRHTPTYVWTCPPTLCRRHHATQPHTAATTVVRRHTARYETLSASSLERSGRVASPMQLTFSGLNHLTTPTWRSPLARSVTWLKSSP